MHLLTRSDWNARPPRARHLIARFQPKLILHHAAGAILPGDDSVSLADLRRIKGIQDYHMDTQGWNDIAYSFLFDPDGHFFEGRGIGVANGATRGHGATSYAICVMGHFDQQRPDADLLEGLAQYVAWGYKLGLWPLGFTGGHRDYGQTSCPGNKLYPHIVSINARAKEIYEGEDVTAAEIVDELLARRIYAADKGATLSFETFIQGIRADSQQAHLLSSGNASKLNALKTQIANLDLSVDLDPADVQAIVDAIQDAGIAEAVLSQINLKQV